MKKSTIKNLSLATTALALFSAGVAVSADEATAVVAEAVQTQTSSELKPAAGEAGVASTASSEAVASSTTSSEAATSESNSQAIATSEATTETSSEFQNFGAAVIDEAGNRIISVDYKGYNIVSTPSGATITNAKGEVVVEDASWAKAEFNDAYKQWIKDTIAKYEAEQQTSSSTESSTDVKDETAKSETSTSETAKSEIATKTSSSLNLDQLANGDLSSIVGKYPGKNGGNGFTFNPDGTVTIESDNAKWTETVSNFRNNNGIIEFSSVDAPTRFYIVPAGVASPIDAGLARFDDINRDRIFITGEGSNIVFLDEKLESEKVDNNSKTPTTDTASSSNDKVDTNTTQAAAKTNTTASQAAVAQTPTQSSKKLPSTGEQNTIFAAFVGAILLAGAAILAKVKFLKK